jgi:LuxR family maltose regulon positive regulatory protein
MLALIGAIERMLAAFPAAPPRPQISSPAAALVEPLTAREIEVLTMVAAGLSNQAIADQLVVGLSTVKKHINNAYGKMGVASRTQALKKARELGVIP